VIVIHKKQDPETQNTYENEDTVITEKEAQSKRNTAMMNKYYTRFFISMALCGFESSSAFQMHRRTATSTKIFAENDPFPEIDIDLGIAEDYANNFGKYSAEEIEQCLDELHARRVQNVVLGEEMTPDIMKEIFIEEELNLQLDRLKKEMPESYLFPDYETLDPDTTDATDKEIDGVRMDNGLIAVDLPSRLHAESTAEAVVETKKNSNVVLDELAKEGVLESLAICGFLGLLMMSPNIV